MPDKLSQLLAVHDALCQSTNLSESQRPYSIQGRIDEVQKLMMEELKSTVKFPNVTTDNNDDIPF